jgi:hypothetical protein
MTKASEMPMIRIDHATVFIYGLVPYPLGLFASLSSFGGNASIQGLCIFII